jgi:hypothetical protein
MMQSIIPDKGFIERANIYMKLPERFLSPLTDMYSRIIADGTLSERFAACYRYVFINAEGEYPQPDGHNAPFTDLFNTVVLIARFDNLLSFYKKSNITEQVLRDTLADVAVNIEETEQLCGHIGLDVIRFWWISSHFKGTLFRVGRLQYIYLPESGLLDVHIPRGGKLTGCDDSYKDALVFFESTFPERPVVGFTCCSWLIDPALRHVLPPSSRILSFQQKYRIGERITAQNDAVFPYVFIFYYAPEDLSSLPEETLLQKSLKAYLLSGGTVCNTRGFLRITDV